MELALQQGESLVNGGCSGLCETHNLQCHVALLLEEGTVDNYVCLKGRIVGNCNDESSVSKKCVCNFPQLAGHFEEIGVLLSYLTR